MFRRTWLAILMIAILIPTQASAQKIDKQEPYLFADINIQPSVGVEITRPMVYQGLTYYFSRMSDQTVGLWKTDGTEEGTILVKSGMSSSEEDAGIPYTTWAVFQDILYFAGIGDNYGNELWRTDGTPDGTYRLSDIVAGPGYANPYAFVVVNDWLYFQAQSELSPLRIQIYRTDGAQVQQVTTGLNYLYPDMVAFQGQLYFTASADGKTSLYRTDGTPLTFEVFLPSLSIYHSPQPLIVWQDWLYFSYDDGTNGNELWVTDGTIERTQRFATLEPSGSAATGKAIPYGSGLLFIANDGINGSQVWWTTGMDNTGQPTRPAMVSSIWGAGQIYSITMAGFAGERFLFFSQRLDGVGSAALWAIDTPGGQAHLISLVRPRLTGSAPYYHVQRCFASLGGRSFFEAYDDVHGWELWSSDGTGSGTGMFADIIPGPRSSFPSNFSPCGTRICFSADDSKHGQELWASDGSLEGTALVIDQNTTAPGSYPAGMVNAGRLLYFTADDGVHGQELWRSDGTWIGTFMLNDIGPGDDPGVYPNDLTPVGDWLFFRANDKVHGDELWMTDGTIANTRMVADIIPGTASGYPYWLTPFGIDRLAFTANMGTYEDGLFIADTNGNVNLIKRLPTKAIISLAVLGNYLYFTVENSITHNFPIWRTDGTVNGTELVFSPPTNGSQYMIAELYSVGSYLYYYQYDGSGGSNVTFYQLDGTPGNAQKTDLSQVSLYGFRDASITQFNNDLYFLTNTTASTALIRISTIQNKATQVKFFSAADWWYAGAGPDNKLVHYRNGLLFAMAKPGFYTPDVTFFSSDGTETGTVPLVSGVPRPYNLISVGPFLYFTAFAPENQYELFQWDGTANSPIQITHLPASIPSYLKGAVFYFNNRLYFQGNDGLTGSELWAYDIPWNQAWLPIISR